MKLRQLTLAVLVVCLTAVVTHAQTALNSPALPNGVYTAGVDQNGIARPMLGMNSSGAVNLDPDARGTRLSGSLTVVGTTTHTGTVVNSGNMTIGGTLGVTGATTLSSTLAAGATTITGALSSSTTATFGTTVAVGAFTGATGAAVCYDATAAIPNTLATCTSLTILKENIYPVADNSAVYTINHLNPVGFQFKPNSTTGLQQPPQYGFLAEEVESIDPRLSSYYQGELNGVNYDAVVAVLVRAVQEQQKQIDFLSDKLNSR